MGDFGREQLSVVSDSRSNDIPLSCSGLGFSNYSLNIILREPILGMLE